MDGRAKTVRQRIVSAVDCVVEFSTTAYYLFFSFFSFYFILLTKAICRLLMHDFNVK